MATSHYPPAYVAGVELITERMARWLAGAGHAVEVVCVEQIDASQHGSVHTSEQDDVVVHRLGLKLAERASTWGCATATIVCATGSRLLEA